MQISFLNPGFFLLLILIPVLWFVPRKVDRKVQGILRSLLVTLLVAALAQPVLLSSDPELYQVFVVDRSASLSDAQLAEGDGIVAGLIAQVPDKDKVSIITLGGSKAQLNDDQYGSRLNINSVSTSSLSRALQAASQQIPASAQGVVTLISDGLSTDRRWGPAVQGLIERRIPVNSYDLGTNLDDIYPASIDVAEQLRVGQTVRVAVTVIGQTDNFRVRLLGADGELAMSEALASDGRAVVEMEFEATSAGFMPLTAEVEVAGSEANDSNNRLARTLAIQDPLKALYIGQRMVAGPEKLNALLGRGFDIVDGASQQLDGRFDFSGYQVAIIDDAPARNLSKAFQNNLKQAVSDQGLGLIYAGGEAAFGGGGYDKTAIAEALPIEFKQKNEKKDPSTALVIIVDSSGSMRGTRIDVAKQIARLASRKLQAHDRIGIVEFYGAKHWAIPLQPATNKIEIDRAIGRIEAEGGTVLLPAIEEAYYGLKNIDTRYKHILVLTDAGIEDGPYEQMLRKISKDGINVSTVLVGPEVHNVIMNDMANWGKGRFYSVEDRFNLVELILKQPVDNKMPAYKSGTFNLTSRSGKGWWGKVDRTAIPQLNGYVETRTRPGAEVLLEVTGSGHPVLSSWQFGLGRVTALMTEPVGPGTESWQNWKAYGQMLGRVISRTAADGQTYGYQLDRNDNGLNIKARRFSSDATLAPALTQVNAQGVEQTALDFKQVAPDLYQAKLVIHPQDDVYFNTAAKENLVSCSLDDFRAETQVDPESGLNLKKLAEVTGGAVVASGDAPVLRLPMNDSHSALSLTKLWHWLILLAILAYLAELIYRRWPKQN